MSTTLSAGLGLKPEHFEEALACSADGLWFELHPENYMADGGPRRAWLERIRARWPISLHGVALSLAADAPPDPVHLRRLKALVDRLQPALVSEHLAWSAWGGIYYPDLLPFPRTHAALLRIADNVSQVQDGLQRPIAIENPSHYIHIDGHEYDETTFLRELATRTGCTLLLDVNNVHVSAANLQYDAAAYIDGFPHHLVSEIHLAGHTHDAALGTALLIDSHDAPVGAAVWTLYERLVRRTGPRPTLVERDGNVPAFRMLMEERDRAHSVLATRFAKAA
ncbi:MAG: DUF692 domain-containing protein [Rhodospirillaceae bacterium]